jgi:hypothetical protein
VTRQADDRVRRNQYVARAHLDEQQVREIVRLFALECEATKVAAMTGISRRTVNRYFRLLRERMARESESHAPSGLPSHDPADHAGHRVPGFAIVARPGRIYTWLLSPDPWAGVSPWGREPGAAPAEAPPFDALVDFRSGRLMRVGVGGDPDARVAWIDGLESFWSQTKARLARKRGLRARYVHLHLKESEFRFNHRTDDLYRTLLTLLRD